MTISDIYEHLAKQFGEQRVKNDEHIAPKLTSRTGGRVRIYLETQKQEELINALNILRGKEQKFIVIGTGSHTIFSDEGYNGVVIKNNCRKFEILNMRGKIKNNRIDVDKAYLYAESGCLLNQAVRYSLENGMSGLEDLLGTPGSIGGFLKRSLDKDEKNSAVNRLYQIRLIDKNGRLKFIDPSKNPLTDSSKVIDKGDTILSATFTLTPGDEKKLWEKATKVATEKEKLFTMGRPLGLIFKDITLSVAMSTPTPGNTTSASELIDKSFSSDIKIGGACVLADSGNMLLNTGNATTKDIMDLVKEIRSKVFKKFGVKLEMQIEIIN